MAELNTRNIFITVVCCAIFLLTLAMAAHAEEGDIFDDWVEEGNSFTAEGIVYDVSAGISDGSAALNSPTMTLVLGKGQCIEREKKMYCLEDWTYVIGGTIKIHGKDTQRFHIRITPVAPSLVFERKIDNKELEPGQRGTVSIKITNEGQAPAMGVSYEETVPSAFRITNNYQISQSGSKMFWKGSIARGAILDLSYTIEGRETWSGTIEGVLTYSVNGVQKQEKHNLAVKSTGLIDVNYKTDAPEIGVGEETLVFVKIVNQQSAKIDVTLNATFPLTLEIVATNFNLSSGNTYSWNGELDEGEEKEIATRVRGLAQGDAAIRVIGLTGLGIGMSRVEKIVPFEVTLKEAEILIPSKEFVKDVEGTLKVFLKNTNEDTALDDIKMEAQSSLFNASGTAAKFGARQYDPVISYKFTPAEAGSLPVKVFVTYNVGGKEQKIEKSFSLTIKDPASTEVEPKEEPKPENKTEETKPTSVPEVKKSGIGAIWADVVDFFKKMFGKK